MVENQPTRVVIAGGGPVGLLAASVLLSRKNKSYDVCVLEAKDDPRYSQPGPRSYSIGLNIRGRSAIRELEDLSVCPGLWSDISRQGVESDSFFLHIGKQKFHIRKPSPKISSDDAEVPPTLLIQRNKLCDAMIRNLERNYLSSNRLKINFNSRILNINLAAKTIITTGNQEYKYDLLIGADGVQSAVRNSLLGEGTSGADGFKAEEILLSGQYKVMLNPTPESLELHAIHAMENKTSNFSLFVIPTTENRTCTLVSWKKIGEKVSPSDVPDSQSTSTLNFFDQSTPMEEVKRSIAESYPVFGEPSDEAVMQLRSQMPSEIRTIRCNRYHHSEHRVVLMGDSAHSTGGSLGQGANSGLQDVLAFAKLLEAQQDDLQRTLSAFSEQQSPEGLALWQLLQLPPRGLWTFPYQIIQFFLNFINKLKIFRRAKFIQKFMPKPIQILLSQTLTPFTQIVKLNAFWIHLALRNKTDMRFSPEQQ